MTGYIKGNIGRPNDGLHTLVERMLKAIGDEEYMKMIDAIDEEVDDDGEGAS